MARAGGWKWAGAREVSEIETVAGWEVGSLSGEDCCFESEVVECWDGLAGPVLEEEEPGLLRGGAVPK